MKYTTEIEINQPREKVVELFTNPEYLKEWQEGLQSHDLIFGTMGEVGSKYLLKFDLGNRKIEMVETLKRKDLPNEITFTYEAKGVWNMVNTQFIEKSKDTTICKTSIEFRFKGLMKIMAFFMQGAFKKQTCKYMEDFKRMVESKN